MLLTSPGVFFLSYLRIPFVPQGVMNFLASPIPNWDRIFLGHTTASLNPLFHSVLLPLILLIVVLNIKSARAFALGVALGFAAHLFIDSFFSLANVSWVPGTFFFDKIWLILNGLFCFGLAFIAGKDV
jgi:serine protease